jgi:hypothetical protein
VRRLSRHALALSVTGAVERRRAVRALTEALEVDPPFDPLFDGATRTTGS